MSIESPAWCEERHFRKTSSFFGRVCQLHASASVSSFLFQGIDKSTQKSTSSSTVSTRCFLVILFQFSFFWLGVQVQAHFWWVSLLGLRKQWKYSKDICSALLFGTIKKLWAYTVLLARNKILSLDRIYPLLSQKYIPRKIVEREVLVVVCVLE